MARAVSEKVGRGICPAKGCDEPVMYRRSVGGMLTHKCDYCDSSGYAIPGSAAHASRMASIAGSAPAPVSQPAQSAAVEPSPPQTTKKAPAAVKPRAAFSFADL